MAAPAYTTDLTTIVDFDGTPSSPTVAEPSTGWTAGRSPVVDTDFPIQSTNHCSLVMNATGKAGALCTNASSFSWSTGDYLFGWIVWLAPGAIAEQNAGGLAMLCGSSTSAYKVFYVGGKSFGAYPYGGWQNFAVDPELTEDEVFGSPTDYYIVGAGANVLSAVSKGSPLGFDVFRYGRGELRVAYGSLGDGYATFAGMAAANDNTNNRWGLFQAIAGGYKFKGLMVLGYGGLTNFTDQNKNIVIDNTEWVQSDFNAIEIRNGDSIINWTGISISSLGTISKGTFEVVDDAEVNFDSCTFADMDTFIFQPGSTVLSSIFRRCGQVTAGGATFTESKFENSPAAASLLASSTNLITKCAFISDGSNHAIEIDTPGEYTFSGHTFTGYATENGSTGNEVIYNNSGGEVILNASGNTGTISYRNGPDASTVVNATVNVTIIANVSLVGAEVRIYDLDTTPPEYGTELAGIESNGTANYIYAGTEGNTILIQIMKDDYIEYTQEYVMPGSNSDLNILLKLDENS